jgi:nicotinate-nucleotide adenylyltransferase
VRIGLFGGTFNPVHWGHLRAAEEIRELYNLKQVIFIPTNISPHKSTRELIDAKHRLHMLDLAVETNPYFVTSDVELQRCGESYSVETISYFKEAASEEVSPFFIVGLDAFLEISTWKDFRAIFSLCNFIVMTRPGYQVRAKGQLIPVEIVSEFTYKPDEKRFIHESQFSTYVTEITALDISSNAIRSYIRAGRSVKYLVPEAVEAYMSKHKFYLS